MDSNFERARAFFIDGVQHYEAGRYEQAEQKFLAALALVPGRVSSLTNLGAARLKLGRLEEALAVLDEALAQEPDNVEALGHRGTALAELGRREEALASFDRVLQLQPAQGAAWTHRGSLLRELGRTGEAIASFEKAIAHGADRELNAYYLASLRQGAAPAAPPLQYVQALFDAYAGQFDEHLVSELRYDAPQVLVQRVASTGRRFARALDLGCGTGLCGPLLQPLCEAVDGIDLSANMLQKAQALGAYTQLEQAELHHYLQSTQQRYEVVVAADVLVYLGDLQPLFAGVARVLQPKGVFCFTVEQAEGDAAYELRPSLRYAHSEPALRALAAQHGFEVMHLEQRPVREDQRVPIPGLFVWLQKA
jgi:predicted TPR repeat methyltransferase